MNPSRELDALIAERVMGWKWVMSLGMAALQDRDGTIHYGDTYPRYSTDIAAAWEVVEKLTDRPAPHFELSKGRDGWHAGFDLDRPFKRVMAKADTAPHAICLAALKAVGNE